MTALSHARQIVAFWETGKSTRNELAEDGIALAQQLISEPAPAFMTIGGIAVKGISPGRLGTDHTITFYLADGTERFFAGTAAACMRQLSQLQPQIAVLEASH